MTLDRIDPALAELNTAFHRRTPPPEHDEKKARREWSQRFGIKVGAHAPCPTRQLLRKRCPGEGCCWFSGTSQPSAFDHVYAKPRIRDGARGILTMPYGLTDDSAVELANWCEHRGCSFTVLGDGWHFPGTVAIVIYRAP